MEIIYVDDILFWSVYENNIHDLAMNLRLQGVDLEQEDDAAGFLGVTLGRDEATSLMEMKQVGLIDRVIETLGLDDGMSKNKYTPSESSPLVKDADGPAACVRLSCLSVGLVSDLHSLLIIGWWSSNPRSAAILDSRLCPLIYLKILLGHALGTRPMS